MVYRFLQQHKLRLVFIAIAAFVSYGLSTQEQKHPNFHRLSWGEGYQVSDEFLGVAVDAAMLTQGEWWAKTNAPPRPLDFRNIQLVNYTKKLNVSWVRLGAQRPIEYGYPKKITTTLLH